MLESNPSGFITEGFDETEVECGVAGKNLVEPQWAEVEVLDYKKFTEGTPVLRPVLRLTENSKTPGRRLNGKLWFTDKQFSQITVDGWCVAAGVGKPPNIIGPTLKKKDGQATQDKHQRPPAPVVEGLMDTVGQALKGRRLIVSINVEVDKDGVFDDQNGINGYHRVTEENLAAIREAGFEAKGVEVKEKTIAGGKKTRFLAAKKTAKKAATSSGAAPAVLD